MSAEITIRLFTDDDAPAVRELFTLVNRQLAPPDLKEAFEDYIALSLREEIDRISEYYAGHRGKFWVVVSHGEVMGMFGVEASGSDDMELRRMYVHPSFRRSGIASRMLEVAEAHCRREGKSKLRLSTSEIQSEALFFYKASGYNLVDEVVTLEASHKTLGGGVRRYHFEKQL